MTPKKRRWVLGGARVNGDEMVVLLRNTICFRVAIPEGPTEGKYLLIIERIAPTAGEKEKKR